MNYNITRLYTANEEKMSSQALNSFRSNASAGISLLSLQHMHFLFDISLFLTPPDYVFKDCTTPLIINMCLSHLKITTSERDLWQMWLLLPSVTNMGLSSYNGP